MSTTPLGTPPVRETTSNFPIRKQLETNVLRICAENANEMIAANLRPCWGKSMGDCGISDEYLFFDEHEEATEKLEEVISTASALIIGELHKTRPNPDDLQKLLDDEASMLELSTSFSRAVLIEIGRERIKALSSRAQVAEKKAEDSIKDPLMGFINAKGSDSAKDAFRQQCTDDVHESNKLGKELTVLFVDIDNFSRFNNRYISHAMGDLILSFIAKVLASDISQNDRVYRYGGEEIVVVAKDADVNKGCKIAERLRKVVEKNTCYATYIIQDLDERGNETGRGKPSLIKKTSFDRLLATGKVIDRKTISGDKITYVEDAESGEIIALLEAHLTISAGVSQCPSGEGGIKEDDIIQETINGTADQNMYFAKGKRSTVELKQLSTNLGLPGYPDRKLFKEKSGEITTNEEKRDMIISVEFIERLGRYEEVWEKEYANTNGKNGGAELEVIKRIKVLTSVRNQIWVDGDRYFPPENEQPAIEVEDRTGEFTAVPDTSLEGSAPDIGLIPNTKTKDPTARGHERLKKPD